MERLGRICRRCPPRPTPPRVMHEPAHRQGGGGSPSWHSVASEPTDVFARHAGRIEEARLLLSRVCTWRDTDRMASDPESDRRHGPLDAAYNDARVGRVQRPPVSRSRRPQPSRGSHVCPDRWALAAIRPAVVAPTPASRFADSPRSKPRRTSCRRFPSAPMKNAGLRGPAFEVFGNGRTIRPRPRPARAPCGAWRQRRCDGRRCDGGRWACRRSPAPARSRRTG